MAGKVIWNEQCDADFDKAFDSVDTSGTGQMTFSDVKEKILVKVLRRMGHNPTDTEIAQYLEDMDTNREFMFVLWRRKIPGAPSDIIHARSGTMVEPLTFRKPVGWLPQEKYRHYYFCNLFVTIKWETTNRDELVSKAEFKEWSKSFIEALQDPEKALRMAVKVMFRNCDLNADGRISKYEFRTFMARNGRQFTDEEINMLFTVVDNDGDENTLNLEELLSMLQIGRNAAQNRR